MTALLKFVLNLIYSQIIATSPHTICIGGRSGGIVRGAGAGGAELELEPITLLL